MMKKIRFLIKISFLSVLIISNVSTFSRVMFFTFLDVRMNSEAWCASALPPVIDQSRGSGCGPSCHGGSPAADHKGVEQCEATKFTEIGAGSAR